MRVTYIKHSGFLVEWEDIACLFDCAEGDFPTVSPEKKLYIFISHGHSDHFDPAVFQAYAAHPNHCYILSDAIRAEIPAEEKKLVHTMAPDRKRVFSAQKGVLSVSTLGSTDQGVAFVVSYAGRSLYHAGDLHWWAWPDDTPEEEADMKNRFFAELRKLKGVTLDAAFIPLDPRLGGNFWMGFDALMRSANVRHAYPMHLWEKYDTVKTLRQMSVAAPYRDRIVEIGHCHQVFEYGKEVQP